MSNTKSFIKFWGCHFKGRRVCKGLHLFVSDLLRVCATTTLHCCRDKKLYVCDNEIVSRAFVC